MAPANKSSAITLNDTESRQWLQTKTQSGHNWDQVIGVSQRIINKNFERLFELYPQMSEMYNSDDSTGMIDAKLLPPQILIPGGNSSVSRSEVLFQLRFESGSMMHSNGAPLIEDMTGWVITAPVKVDSKKVTVPDNESPEATAKILRAKILKENAWIDRFDVAGAYSAERLYAKLSSIRWYQFDVDHTYCGTNDEGKKISFHEWAAADGSRLTRLNTWLVDWSYKQDLAGRNNIGVSFQLPPAKNVNDPTYEPVFMMNQTYPYISKPQGALGGATGPEGAGGCNAFLYTEIVKIPGLLDTRRPDDHTLVWSGNFCTLPTTVDGKDAIDGTFVMGRNVFLETFLLPELQPLNKATDICHGKPYGEQKGDLVTCFTPYSLGYDSQHPSLTDDVFKFSNVNDSSDPEAPNGYRWTKTNVQGPIDQYNIDSEKGDLRVETKDEMTVDVTWVPGTPNIKIAGKAFSQENCIWNHSYQPNKSWDQLWAWVRDKYTVSWELTLELSTKTGENGNGILDINVRKGDENAKVIVDYKPDQHHIVQDGHRDDFHKQILINFNDVIPRMIHNLKVKLEGGGRFVFPGNGVFAFSEPMLGRYGHLLTRVDYKPLTKDEKLLVPRPPKLLDRIGVTPPIQKPVMNANEPKWHLEWTRTDPVPAALKKSKIWLRGTNVDPKLWCEFKQININWTSGKKDRNLFAEDRWVLEAAPDQGAKTSAVEGEKIPPTTTTTSTTAADEKTKPVASALPAITATAAEQAVTKDSTSNSEAAREATKLPTETSKETTADEAVLVERPAEKAADGGTAQAPKSSGILDRLSNLLSGSPSNTDLSHEPLPQPAAAKAQEPTKTGNVTETKVATPGGVITLRQKLTGPDKAILKEPTKSAAKWLVLLDSSGKDGVLRLRPGDWVEVEWEGRVGPAGTYSLTVNETWNETALSYLRGDVKVAVSAPAEVA